MKTLILNKIKCLQCKDVLISHHCHDFKYCKCGSVAIDGGRDYTRRLGEPSNWEELSVYSNAPFETIRESLHRGTYDKQGKRKWVVLKDTDDDHLLNIIRYMEDNKQCGSIYHNFMLKETEYRNLEV